MSSFTLRKSFIGLAAAGLLGTGLGLPAVAQAAPSGDSEARSARCDRQYRDLAPGLMAAFRGANCKGTLGVDRGEEWSWATSAGQFSGRDNDSATSLVNKGTGRVSTVRFFRHAGYSGGHICLTKGEKYADRLGSDDRFSNGSKANNAISSHNWTTPGKCKKFMD